MKLFLLLAAATLAYTQASGGHDNYYSLAREAQVGERFITQLQLMVILAHAMGHVALRHPTRGMTLGELAQVEVQVASRSVPEEAPQKVKAVALKRFAFDRACEIEADGYAVKLLKDSGADPATLVAYLRTLPPQQNKEMSVYPARCTSGWRNQYVRNV